MVLGDQSFKVWCIFLVQEVDTIIIRVTEIKFIANETLTIYIKKEGKPAHDFEKVDK